MATAFAAPLTVIATDIGALPERERASYCSGVLGQQSLLFLQVASIQKKLGNEEKYKSSRYHSDQLLIRSEVLGAYGGNPRLKDRGYEETGDAMQKAQAHGKNPVKSFYNKTTECFAFYKFLEGTLGFQRYQDKAKSEIKKKQDSR